MSDPQKSGWAERPDDKRYDVVEGEHFPPDPNEQRTKRAKGLGAAGLGIGALLLKFKGLLLLLPKAFYLVKFLSFGGSFFISLWFYALFWGWQFALVFVLMILAHEMGHYVTIRSYGLPARLPMFVPFLGAYTVGGVPESLEHDAYIALAGPLTGLGVAAICFGFGYETHQPFWYMAAYIGAFVNLFNMIPTPPFDGGRIAGALSPALWIGGFALFVFGALALHVSLFFIVIFGALAIPSVIAAWRGHVDPRFATMTSGARLRVAVWYLVTLFALVCLMSAAHVNVPQPAA